jgi:hypothetical protein
MANERLMEIVKEEVEGVEEPDAVIVLNRVMNRVTDDMVEDMIEPFIFLTIQDHVRNERRRVTTQARRDANQREYTSRQQINESDARDGISARIESETQRRANQFFNVWKETPTGRKFLGDCSVDDLLYSRDQQMRRAAELADAAERDDRLAIHLSDSGYDTLREMGYDEAIKAFSDTPHLINV